MPADMDKEAAHEYLSSLLNQNLRVVTTDGRLFWGQFKCTDAVRNPDAPLFALLGSPPLLICSLRL